MALINVCDSENILLKHAHLLLLLQCTRHNNASYQYER